MAERSDKECEAIWRGLLERGRLRAKYGAYDDGGDAAARVVEGLSEPWREYYEERAAVREYDGGMVRPEAEKMALVDVMQRIER